jgi:hypothetical protein
MIHSEMGHHWMKRVHPGCGCGSWSCESDFVENSKDKHEQNTQQYESHLGSLGVEASLPLRLNSLDGGKADGVLGFTGVFEL